MRPHFKPILPKKNLPDPGQYLECPKCLGELQESSITDLKTTLKVDQCFACQGIWFDKWELKALLNMECSFKENALAKLKGEWRDIAFDLKKARCPRCQKDMLRIKCNHISADYCKDCEGTWLDGGEIRFFEKNGIENIFKSFICSIKDALQKKGFNPTNE